MRKCENWLMRPLTFNFQPSTINLVFYDKKLFQNRLEKYLEKQDDQFNQYYRFICWHGCRRPDPVMGAE